MLQKLTADLTEDMAPLLPVGIRFDEDDAIEAFDQVWTRLAACQKASVLAGGAARTVTK